jgi:O-antigen ligase
MLIMGSRPVGSWFAPRLVVSNVAAGSPYDRLVLGILILFAIFILIQRKIEWSQILKDNRWLIVLYLYAGLSILWSDFTFVSFKRWIKLSGAIPIALVVLTEQQPLQALESVFRRCAYVLIPLSLVLVKYFLQFGVAFDRWSGQVMQVGVTTHKNSLGELCAFSAFILLWATLRKWRSGELLKSRSQTFADILVIGIALFLLHGYGESYSATSIAVLIIGVVSLLVFSRTENLTRFTATHLKAVMISIILIVILFGALLLPTITSFLGRDESLTGRTLIWQSVLDVASRNYILGVGYGGFWGFENEITSEYRVGQSHNGYLEIYLQIGIVGIIALFAFLLEFCGKIKRELHHVFDWGVIGICFLLMVMLYNYTEASFLKTSYMWTITVFLTVVFSAACLPQQMQTD